MCLADSIIIKSGRKGTLVVEKWNYKQNFTPEFAGCYLNTNRPWQYNCFSPCSVFPLVPFVALLE